MPKVPRYFALVPAAGSGARVGSDIPKQYLEVAGHPLVYHALRALQCEPRIGRTYLVVAPSDRARAEPCVRGFSTVSVLACGGETRAASVLNGLAGVAADIEPDDWVLVHDAARPCVSAAALARLIDEIGDDATGGLLAVPVADTLKRADDGRAVRTEPRAGLWQAQTPQMFRYGVLVDALRAAGTDAVTDEAGAVERLGLRPKLVMGEARNLKVTYPDDLALARSLLTA